MSSSPAYTNRLLQEASPYLQQHGRNPVDWYPWGEEALLRAKREDRPIFLSIGYSACHWCHVMERECFDNPHIAAQMNAYFVNIKVDREERPDLDHIYQTVIQLMGRSGGWPLSMFLTPDQKPFFGGTYFPPEDRYGRPAFPLIVEAVIEAYRQKRSEIEEQSLELARAIAQVAEHDRQAAPPSRISPELLAQGARKLWSRFDDKNGGFGTRPKFPNCMSLDLLLRAGDPESLARVNKALTAMQRGGIWDHLGGGFHRYSTDEKWLVPHFEKMLYDNALLIRLYAQASVALNDDSFAATASDIGTYLLREMQDAQGGFYATQDADSEGEEGKFFVFSKSQVEQLLPDELPRRAALLHYGITEEGNFERSGATVLAQQLDVAGVASALAAPEAEVSEALSRASMTLLAAREKRPRPFLDEKILAGWNGLVISGLVEAGQILGEPSLVAAAHEAFRFAQSRLIEGGRVFRLAKGDVTKTLGFLDDHAFLCVAALHLYEATGDHRLVAVARAIADQMLESFWDEERHQFFFAPKEGEALLARTEDTYDHAIPSGTSIACLALLKLAALADPSYETPARLQLEALAGAAVANPFGYGQTLCAIDRLARGAVDIVLVGDPTDARTRALHTAIWEVYLPHRNVAIIDPKVPASAEAVAPLAKGKGITDAPTAYVCRGRSCSLPVHTKAELLALLSAPH